MISIVPLTVGSKPGGRGKPSAAGSGGDTKAGEGGGGGGSAREEKVLSYEQASLLMRALAFSDEEIS